MDRGACPDAFLAALYYDQLGRVLESYDYLLDAGRALRMMIHCNSERFKKVHEETAGKGIQDKVNNIVLLTYWECVLLESDVLDELSLPPSTYVLRHERVLPWPNMGLLEQDFPPWVSENYMARLLLRKELNQLHAILYSPAASNHPPALKVQNASEIEMRLRGVTWVTSDLRINVENLSAESYVKARLQAKYWGAQVVLYRPLIEMVLDISDNPRQCVDGTKSTSNTADGSGLLSQDYETPVTLHDFKTYEDIPEGIINKVKQGIFALTKSIEAFHDLNSGRFLVTNMFGVAHAQWGNLLILAAAHRDPYLVEFVDKPSLKSLFRQTIEMLKFHAQPGSALMVDQKIIETVDRHLFPTGTKATAGVLGP
ncbi:c6 zinc finger domain-containing protein [Colletotrichum incanum]|uniref:C6 zinc finger domain-containing protein n=1 Tax=Colletotrichum incanum TaxID=1573173 RepID=A0A161W149_COLIC|nr:c6 zinc finger domain-containing protein [Colletotrichum incanum]